MKRNLKAKGKRGEKKRITHTLDKIGNSERKMKQINIEDMKRNKEIPTSLYAYPHPQTHIRCKCIHTHLHTCIQTYIHTYTHPYTKTHTIHIYIYIIYIYT